MTIKHFAAIAAVAIGTFCGVNTTLAETRAVAPGMIVTNEVTNMLPKPLAGEAFRPTALVVQVGEFVFCTATSDIEPIVGNVGVFVQETDNKKLCFPIEAYPLQAIELDIKDFAF